MKELESIKTIVAKEYGYDSMYQFLMMEKSVTIINGVITEVARRYAKVAICEHLVNTGRIDA